MKYTKEQVDKFNKMFSVRKEYTCYAHVNLTEEGIHEEDTQENEYNTDAATITLSNGNIYEVHFGTSNDAEGLAIEAFNELVRLNYDEEEFEKYLQGKSGFSPS